MARQKQVQTNFRTTPEMKKRLEAAAQASGLTFNKEVNRRLAESFNPGRQLDPVLDRDPVLFAITIVMAKAMKKTANFASLMKDDSKDQLDWHTDAYVYAKAVDAAIEILNLIRPPDDTIAGPHFGPDELQLGEAVARSGKMWARGEARLITSGETTASGLPPDDTLRAMLGPQVIERIQTNLEKLK